MRNTNICCSVFSARYTALMRDRSPISQEVSICITHHCIVKFPVAQGTSVPIFNGSPPL
jgi:hypothetical protein